MLSAYQETKIFAFIPSVLGGETITKIQSGQLLNNETYPLIVVSFITPGSKVIFPQWLRDEQDPDTGMWTTWFGQYNTCTVSVKILSTDLAELKVLTNEFLIEVHNLGPGAFALTDRVQFRGTDPPKLLSAFSDPPGKYKVHRMSIDLFFKYEFSWPKTSYPMTVFSHDIGSYNDVAEGGSIALLDYIHGNYFMDLSPIAVTKLLTHQMTVELA